LIGHEKMFVSGGALYCVLVSQQRLTLSLASWVGRDPEMELPWRASIGSPVSSPSSVGTVPEMALSWKATP
jgi:hypothetical protein